MNTGRIRRMIKWAESEQLVPKGTYQTLCTVSGLQQGRTKARESTPIGPVSDEHVEAVLQHAPQTVGDMIRFQRATGCRPNEACQLRLCDLDRSGDVWRFGDRSE